MRRRSAGWVFRWCFRVLCAVALVFFLTYILLGFTPMGKWLAGNMSATPAVEDLVPADAIVILGGDPYRAVTGAWLFQQGLAPRVIVSADSARMLQTLEVCGVPSCLVQVEDLASVTADNPRTIQTLPGITPQSSLILVTSKYHPARVRMIFERADYEDFQVYSRESQWWELFRDKSNIGAVPGIYVMYELLAYGKDWL